MKPCKWQSYSTCYTSSTKPSNLLIVSLALQVVIDVLTGLHLTWMYYVFLLVERQLAHVLDFRV